MSLTLDPSDGRDVPLRLTRPEPTKLADYETSWAASPVRQIDQVVREVVRRHDEQLRKKLDELDELNQGRGEGPRAYLEEVEPMRYVSDTEWTGDGPMRMWIESNYRIVWR